MKRWTACLEFFILVLRTESRLSHMLNVYWTAQLPPQPSRYFVMGKIKLWKVTMPGGVLRLLRSPLGTGRERLDLWSPEGRCGGRVQEPGFWNRRVYCLLVGLSRLIMHYTIHLLWLSVSVGFPLKLKGFTGRNLGLNEIRNQQYGDGLLDISRPGKTSKIKLALFLHLARERLCGEGCSHCLWALSP